MDTDINNDDINNLTDLIADNPEDREIVKSVLDESDNSTEIMDTSKKMKQELDDILNSQHDEEPSEYKEEPIADKKLEDVTQEQKKNHHINQIFGSDTKLSDSYAVDMEINTKSHLLDDIDRLYKSLRIDNQDVTGIQPVNFTSSIEEIKGVHGILTRKNKRSRLVNSSREVLTMLAFGLETLFDGKREFFGYKPDLTGWSDTVRVKARRLEYELSSLAESMFDGSNVSNGAIIAFELLPSAVIYSRDRNRTKENDTAHDAEYQDAMGRLNSDK